MKLKYDFVLREVVGNTVAIAIGDGSKFFNGMIKLNESGKFIFELLLSNSHDIESISQSVAKKYDIDNKLANETVVEFIKLLKENGLLEE